MKFLVTFISILVVAHGALLPIDQSVVNVKSERSGQDYSYSIQENRGIAIEPLPIQHVIPALKTITTKTHETTNFETAHQPIRPAVYTLEYAPYPLLSYPSFYNNLPFPYPYGYPLNYNVLPLAPN